VASCYIPNFAFISASYGRWAIAVGDAEACVEGVVAEVAGAGGALMLR